MKFRVILVVLFTLVGSTPLAAEKTGDPESIDFVVGIRSFVKGSRRPIEPREARQVLTDLSLVVNDVRRELDGQSELQWRLVRYVSTSPTDEFPYYGLAYFTFGTSDERTRRLLITRLNSSGLDLFFDGVLYLPDTLPSQPCNLLLYARSSINVQLQEKAILDN